MHGFGEEEVSVTMGATMDGTSASLICFIPGSCGPLRMTASEERRALAYTDLLSASSVPSMPK